MKRRGHGILGNADEQYPICMSDRPTAHPQPRRYNAPFVVQNFNDTQIWFVVTGRRREF